MKHDVPTITPGKLARLAAVEHDPAARRHRGPAGCACQRIGWTELLYKLSSSGQTMPASEYRRQWPMMPGEAGRPDYTIAGEVLTAEGRRVLAAVRAGRLKWGDWATALVDA